MDKKVFVKYTEEILLLEPLCGRNKSTGLIRVHMHGKLETKYNVNLATIIQSYPIVFVIKHPKLYSKKGDFLIYLQNVYDIFITKLFGKLP